LALFTRNHLLSNTVSYPRRKELITMIFINIMSLFTLLCYNSSPATWWSVNPHLITTYSVPTSQLTRSPLQQPALQCQLSWESLNVAACTHKSLGRVICLISMLSLSLIDVTVTWSLSEQRTKPRFWKWTAVLYLLVQYTMCLSMFYECLHLVALSLGSSCRSSPSRHCKAHATKYDS
jgi:hypothetical protein